MAAWSSSSLAVSENRHDGSGLFKHNKAHSKQHMMEFKMFGKKMGMHGKDFPVGRKFRKKNPSDIEKPPNMDMEDYEVHAVNKNTRNSEYGGSIGMSPKEFDRTLKSSVTHDMKKKRTPFSRKFFG